MVSEAIVWRTRCILGALALALPAATPARAASERVIYSFKGVPDGRYPTGSLIAVNGVLYGTTQVGGPQDDGTVFSVTPEGLETVLHAFAYRIGGDGKLPTGDLLDLGGTLYGVTIGGTTAETEWGTVFHISPAGDERARGLPNAAGNYPYGGIAKLDRLIYGTAMGGGVYNSGTVFSALPNGIPGALYDFKGKPDCGHPNGRLLRVGSTLYGTSCNGGTNDSGCVFSITPDGVETVLHSFTGDDGSSPHSSLVYIRGTLYGTTTYGGLYHRGTVFAITPAGDFRTVYAFGKRPTDAAYPGELTRVGNLLYGTTSNGGDLGSGTVFSLTQTGVEHVLHSFGAYPDGRMPLARLTLLDGTLYGTTAEGGANDKGTVFAITP